MIKRSIASKGLMETISYSFINNKESINFGGGSSSLKIVNPISDELSEMRPTPLASLVSIACLLYTSPSPRDRTRSRMPSSA